jgi:hypothetical protein
METIKVIEYVKSPKVSTYGYVLPGIESVTRTYDVYYYDDINALECALKAIPEIQKSFDTLSREYKMLLEYVTISYADWTEKYNSIPAWRRWIAVKAPLVEDYEPLKEAKFKMTLIGTLLTEASDLKYRVDNIQIYTKPDSKPAPTEKFKFEDHADLVDRLNKFRHLGVDFFFTGM